MQNGEQIRLAGTLASTKTGHMSENVIKFQRPKQPKPPRHTPPWLRRAVTILAIIAAVVAVYGYFYFTGSGAPAP
jgi:hypothetical protein